jgi:hypothetical protein
MNHQLVSDMPEWIVTLRDGAVIRLLAHGYSNEDEELVFSALMYGRPHYEVHLVRIPASIVANVLSA